MRLLPTCALLLAASMTVPAICQSNSFASSASADASATALPTNASDPSVNFAALREDLSQQNKVLQKKLDVQRGILKKNQELLKEAQKLDAENKRLEEERKKIEAQNAELEKQRAALKAAQRPDAPQAN